MLPELRPEAADLLNRVNDFVTNECLPKEEVFESQIKDGDEITGNETRVKVVKNKLAPPFKTVRFDIMYSQGISKVSEIIDLGVQYEILDKSGSWYSYQGDKIGQGKDKVRAFLMAHPDIMTQVESQIRALMLPEKKVVDAE